MKRNVRAEYSIDADDYEAIGASDPDTGETTLISLIVYRGTALDPELVALELAPADEIEAAKEALWLAACEQERREKGEGRVSRTICAPVPGTVPVQFARYEVTGGRWKR